MEPVIAKTTTYILYHANCRDGTGAKYAAWKKFGNKGATYLAVNYGHPPPKMDLNSEVYILDFSYPKDVLEQLQGVHKSVVVLDHHASAKEQLEGVKGCHFDMTKSGAVLAWEYFHPDKSVPQLLLHVQDRDLWKFKLSSTREVNEGLLLLEGDLNKWDEACSGDLYSQNTDKSTLHSLFMAGSAIIKSNEIKIKSVLKNKVKIINFHGYEAGITNSTELASEIGNAICESKDWKVDLAMIYCITPQNEVMFSLRSVGAMDVSKLAEKYGGGGHRNAAGLKCTLQELLSILKVN